MLDTDHFRSPRQRLRRAHNRISKLESIIAAFDKKKPGAIFRELDTDGVTEIHGIRFTDRLPDVCEDVAAEALLALRSCLDQAGYASAVAAGKMNPKGTLFPIGDDPAGLEAAIGRKICKDLPPEILTLFRNFNPYKGGNDALWLLNKMRNAVHTVFAPVMLFTHKGTLQITGEPGFYLDPVNCQWDRAKNEIIFLRSPKAANVQYDVGFIFAVTFDHIELAPGQTATGVLSTMAGEVERVLMATEAECRRIGLIP